MKTPPPNNGRTKQPGIRDVARLAGVAAITVSRAFSDPHTVAAKTRHKIARAAASIGYIPNRLASSFSSSRTMTIGVVIATLRDSMAEECVAGFGHVLKAHGYQLLLGSSGFSPADEEAIVLEFLSRRVDGVYLTGATHTDRTRKLLGLVGMPTVEVVTLPKAPVDLAVGFSNFQAAYEVTRLLAGKGLRKVALFSLPSPNNERQLERQAGFRAAVAECGLCAAPDLVAEVGMDLGAAARQMHVLLEAHPDVEGLFCASDYVAAGAMLEAQRMGIAVPERLAIVGFDGLEIGKYLNPGLTTVAIPCFRIGERAAQLLLQRMAGQTVAERVVDLGFEIIERGSTPTGRDQRPERSTAPTSRAATAARTGAVGSRRGR